MTTAYYLLNNYTSSSLILDPAASGFGLRAVPSSSDTALPFTFSPIASTTFVKICTTITSTSYCLDVWGDKKTVPHLSEEGNYSGQQWSVADAGNGLVKFSNQYTGSGWYLDVYGDTNGATMSQSDYAGQYWKQIAVDPAAVSSSLVRSATSSPTATTRVSPTPDIDDAGGAPPVASVTPAALSTKSSGLSTGAKAGIGAGCAVLAIVLASLVFAITYWRRKARRNNPESLPVGVATNDEKPVFPDQGSFSAHPKHAYVGTAELPALDDHRTAGDGQMWISKKNEASNVQAGGATMNHTVHVSHAPGELPDHNAMHEMAAQHE